MYSLSQIALLAALGLSATDSAAAFSVAPQPWTFLATTTTPQKSSTSLKAESKPSSSSRGDFLKTITAASAALALPSFIVLQPLPANAVSVGDKVDLPSGVSYDVVKVGDGPQANVGELVGIRFKAFAGDIKIDDIFDTPEPYYTRVGAGGLIKGAEEVLPFMRVGDRFKLIVPSNLAFGSKGRKASAGTPRIPADATVLFEVEMVSLPGREPELIDLIGDEY